MAERKRIVYLFGTGATQAEISLHDTGIRILMTDVREGILKKISTKNDERLGPIKNELAGEGVDVEHLITLYESTGNSKHNFIARKLKQFFREEIQEKLKKLSTSFTPKLFTALIDMHEVNDIDEELVGIMTLNYEAIAESAIKNIHSSINYGIKMRQENLISESINNKSFVFLKLHGSFDWKNEYPVCIEKEIGEEDDVLWIPPGVEKKKDKYPFSLIWGKARELLDCDVLRVIGCSLNRNDWELIQLIYTTQKLNSVRKPYHIEIIDYDDIGKKNKENYPYLVIRTISEIKEVQEYFKRAYNLSDEKLDAAIGSLLASDNINTNIFDIWLRAKGEDLMKKNVPIETEKGFFEKYLI